MALKFKNKKIVIINYGEQLDDEELNRMKQNYDIETIDEINYRCKGFGKVEKSWYLQCVDWIKLIPESVIRNDTYALKLPENLPNEISIYMIAETYSRTGRMPRLLEYKSGSFNRIVDLEYEINFSKNKRKEFNQPKPRKNQEINFNSPEYHQGYWEREN